MAAVDCTIHLISLRPDTAVDEVYFQLRANTNQRILIAGRPHGWIHKPHKLDVDELLAHEWHLFVLTAASSQPLQIDAGVKAHIKINVAIPENQWRQLVDPDSKKPHSTPQLPPEWIEQSTGDLHVPKQRVNSQTTASPAAGTLKLDASMANFLSTSLPENVRQEPVSLFNLFRYRDGDSAIHERYMQDFKNNFGDSAGAYVKFMGPVGPLTSLNAAGEIQAQQQGGDDGSWQEANLTHYDSIFHYAYMLCTDVYQELNKDKVRGLEDTCILLVSEVEMLREG
jgi:hypothetical protein